MWQPGVIQNKLKENHTYLVATNYWTPLNEDNDDEHEETEGEINIIKQAPATTKKKENKWTRWII